ncbi:hypothetical protein Pst134EB_016263 [Puccinia striiformis f. sp. tritici]|nr:hypothetical protein Pst134EB_016263 [Puccinia striiformis f. sp. tritici]
MRKAFKAEIRSFGSDGSMTLVEYVAKTRYKEPPHKITSHAADALMYKASGLLLDEFKNTLSQCSGLDGVYKKKVQEIAIVRHAVVVTGDVDYPKKVYFVEVALMGPYVKYSSNINFVIPEDQQGVDHKTACLMNAFIHWTWINSNGQSLICDLQGVGSILTDPQIIDKDDK